jgi:ABC-2 type transport system ATP-binding protein
MSVVQTAVVNASQEPRAAAVLVARRLTKRFGDTTAVEDLDLAIPAGEVYCLLGPNGAGKTTTINLFLGFVEPTAGSALVGGLDVASHPVETKRVLAYIPEQVMRAT